MKIKVRGCVEWACTLVAERWRGVKGGKRKLCAMPIGRVCCSVRYRRQCQHTRCAQYSYCHTARRTSLSFPAWHLHLSCLAHILLSLPHTNRLHSFPPLLTFPQSSLRLPVHQCHFPSTKLTDPSSFASLSSPSLYILQAWHLARHWFNITRILCAFHPLSHYPLFPTPTAPLSYGHWPLAFSILYPPQKELFVLE